MSSIAGIDYDSNGVFVVEVDEDDGGFIAAWKVHLYVSNGQPDTSFQRARSLADQMPPKARWKDSGVVAIGIEDPYSRFPEAIKAEARIQGAILASLPETAKVWPLKPHTATGWKAIVGLKTSATKPEIAAWARANGAPPAIRQDFYDAFGIARAAREIHEKSTRGGRARSRGAA